MHEREKGRIRNELGTFYTVCDSRIDLLGLGSFYCMERQEAGMDLWFYFVGTGYLLQFYTWHVDFVGTSSDADDGRDAVMVFLLSSVGRIDNVCALEI